MPVHWTVTAAWDARHALCACAVTEGWSHVSFLITPAPFGVVSYWSSQHHPWGIISLFLLSHVMQNFTTLAQSRTISPNIPHCAVITLILLLSPTFHHPLAKWNISGTLSRSATLPQHCTQCKAFSSSSPGRHSLHPLQFWRYCRNLPFRAKFWNPLKYCNPPSYPPAGAQHSPNPSKQFKIFPARTPLHYTTFCPPPAKWNNAKRE